MNFLLVEALERYHYFYGDELKVECPTGSKNMMTLLQVSQELCRRSVFQNTSFPLPLHVPPFLRMNSLFLPDKDGRRPCHGMDPRYASDPQWRDLILFYEYFNGDSGKGCGARYVSRCGVDVVTPTGVHCALSAISA